MFLSIYYIFRIKPMNNESQHYTLAFLARAEKENIQLGEKCGMNFATKGYFICQETGLMLLNYLDIY